MEAEHFHATTARQQALFFHQPKLAQGCGKRVLQLNLELAGWRWSPVRPVRHQEAALLPKSATSQQLRQFQQLLGSQVLQRGATERQVLCKALKHPELVRNNHAPASAFTWQSLVIERQAKVMGQRALLQLIWTHRDKRFVGRAMVAGLSCRYLVTRVQLLSSTGHISLKKTCTIGSMVLGTSSPASQSPSGEGQPHRLGRHHEVDLPMQKLVESPAASWRQEQGLSVGVPKQGPASRSLQYWAWSPKQRDDAESAPQRVKGCFGRMLPMRQQ